MNHAISSRITKNNQISEGYFRMAIAAPTIAHAASPGQFVHLLPRSPSLSDPLLRRAFSIMAADSETIEILYRVEGKGTLSMSRWRCGEGVDLLGPLGLPFAAGQPKVLLVGGGVGIPPLVMIASRRNISIVHDEDSSPAEPVPTIALLGARSASELICEEDFARYKVPVEVATDDGSQGHHGYVTDLLSKHLRQIEAGAVLPTVFSCGPLPMLHAVAAICARFHAPCQVSLEENMPCGIGVCNGCVVPVTGAGDDYSRYRRICLEGPVLWSHEVDWSHYAANMASIKT